MPRTDNSNKQPEVNSTQRTPRRQGDEFIAKKNPLHSFATYNCLFTLSGISERDLQSQRQLFNAPIMNIIARSSGIGDVPRGGVVDPDATDKIKQEQMQKLFNDPNYAGSGSILDRNHDIFFENVNITSVVGPNVERNLANFTKMEFELHEPYAVTFIEKIRACAFRMGYEDYQAAPFLLTIQWKGFDENGRPLEDTQKSLERRVPIFITKVDFDVDQGGARYNVTAVPYPDMAFDDSYKFSRTQIPINVNSVDDWISKVKEGLQKQMQDEREEGAREFDDEYEFDISRIKSTMQTTEISSVENTSIFNTATLADSLRDVEQVTLNGTRPVVTANEPKSDTQIKTKTKGMHIEPNTSIVKAFEDMIRSTKYYQELIEDFWGTYAPGETRESLFKKFQDSKELAKFIESNQYVDWFLIKPKVENLLSKGLDSVTKMYPKRITYQAIPYKVHIGKLVLPGLSLGDIDWSRYSRRNYNYIYTGENIDIQNLRINYKTAYYYRNVRTDPKATGTSGAFYNFKEGIRKWLGGKKQPEPTLPLRQYPSILKQRNLVQEINPKSLRANEFFDYLTNPEADMVKVEMDILGDPAYVAQDAFAPIDDKVLTTGEYDTQFNAFNMESHMPIITLSYRMPADIDDKRGTMFSDTYLDENLFFSGAYQVTKIESQMNQGQFTQTLTLVRINNQSGTTAPAALISAAQDGTKDIIKQGQNPSFYRKEFGKFFRN